ncbi:hypothetical protein SAMN05421736_105197 [Evansella caseinilytica]|uniref:Prepilin-type N-terminal cleavage/methylation domain-containing protein n=1 Tax=Evansella caseinilytica TaxID=1503961 RepID=A0A1H3PTP4_9BACI|nr:prepilin-type N-terminal cleavage/methylation domain-containing protein [Evansella caseinilytica]SDZ04318.1 hypothetical protein SAMN05421736_105197 [Evansella caseinilytica]
MSGKKQTGATLIELLLSMGLISIVLLLAVSIQLASQKQWTNQTISVENQANVRLVMNMITKEIRSASHVSVSANVLTLMDENKNITGEYRLSGNTMMNGSAEIAENIGEFLIRMEGSKLEISVASLPGKEGHSAALSTVLYLRGGDGG